MIAQEGRRPSTAFERPAAGRRLVLALAGPLEASRRSPNDPAAPSDGYATGLVVFVLREAGVPRIGSRDRARSRPGSGRISARSGRWFDAFTEQRQGALHHRRRHQLRRHGAATLPTVGGPGVAANCPTIGPRRSRTAGHRSVSLNSRPALRGMHFGSALTSMTGRYHWDVTEVGITDELDRPGLPPRSPRQC